ncbi:MAG: amidohydrolase [Clostridia bacterium]|nr:amidohydrolase [Clostridia bacterium]
MDYTIAPVCQEELVRIRRQLHMYPELRWDLPLTAALVKEELDKIGVPYEADKYGPNTIVATINPEKTAFTIGIRADMDALPIQERNEDKPYRSRHDGIMHACGHDAHTTMLIGTAKALWAIRDQLTCRVKLLFQPCEEGRPSGARTMCEHGVMEDIDCIIMCHVNCVDDVHVISSSPTVTNCSSVAFHVELGGVSVHVATPHQGVDALAAGVKIYNAIQLLVSREVDPFDTCVMSVTTMQAGGTVATNADNCVLKGSIRCLKEKTMSWARERLTKVVKSVAEEHGVTWDVSWSGDPLPPCTNDPAMYHAFAASARKVVGKEKVIILPTSPGAEDFAYYEKEKPGLLFGLGMRNPEKGTIYPAHTKDWDIDEDALSTGVQVFVQFVLDNMNGIDGMITPNKEA